jgi:uncharacterized protein YdaU (DUF1376 family)
VSTHPYIPLYVDDFEAATTHLTAEEDGVYNRLLRLCWRTPGCSLPDDPAWLARKLRLSSDDFERVARPILREFFRLYRGRFVQRRLKAEYDAISCKRLARKAAGKKGGAAKARKTQENEASNAIVLPAHTRAYHTHTHIQIEDTEAKASGAERPADNIDKLAWDSAVLLLKVQGGMTERNARSFFGRLLSEHGLMARDLFSTITSATVSGTQDPQGYLRKAAAGVARRREPVTPKRVGFV